MWYIERGLSVGCQNVGAPSPHPQSKLKQIRFNRNRKF